MKILIPAKGKDRKNNINAQKAIPYYQKIEIWKNLMKTNSWKYKLLHCGISHLS